MINLLLVSLTTLLVALSTLVLDFVHLTTPRASQSLSSPPLKGQYAVDILRRSACLSNLNSTFGRHKSALLSRTVSPLDKIWEDVDPFVVKVLSKPETLDWYVADVGFERDPDTVTINAAFSCIDRGKSTSTPITWYISKVYSNEIAGANEVGGYKAGADGNNSRYDITDNCLYGRAFEDKRHIVEHHCGHSGGPRFMDPETNTVDKPRSIVGDVKIFDELRRTREGENEADEVVYHQRSGIPVAEGIAFATGFRLFAAKDMITEITSDYHVPMLGLGAITSHYGARLSESMVARGESRTSNKLVVLTMLATGLALLLGVYFVSDAVRDVLIYRNQKLKDMSVEEAVKGMEGWGRREWRAVAGHLMGVMFLTAPIAQAAADGLLDTRQMFEVVSGASVYYSDTKPELSIDLQNPFAGSVFIVSVWMTVRKLDSGFSVALWLSGGFLVFFAAVIVMWVTKRASEIMPGSKTRGRGISLWKIHGYAWLWFKGVKAKNEKYYTVFISFRNTGEEGKKEMMLMGDVMFRKRSYKVFTQKRDREQDRRVHVDAREALWEEIKGTGGEVTGIIGWVYLHDQKRFELTTARTKWYWDYCPRQWEYIRRATNCEPLEWYRTNGVFPPDDCLLLLAMGGLPYAKYIAEVKHWESSKDDLEQEELDRDGVRSSLVFGSEGVELLDNGNDFPSIRQATDTEAIRMNFANGAQTRKGELIAEWSKSVTESRVQSSAGKVRIKYVMAPRTVTGDPAGI